MYVWVYDWTIAAVAVSCSPLDSLVTSLLGSCDACGSRVRQCCQTRRYSTLPGLVSLWVLISILVPFNRPIYSGGFHGLLLWAYYWLCGSVISCDGRVLSSLAAVLRRRLLDVQCFGNLDFFVKRRFSLELYLSVAFSSIWCSVDEDNDKLVSRWVFMSSSLCLLWHFYCVSLLLCE